MNRDSSLGRYIAALHERLDLDQHRYFASLEDGSFERDDFVETQIQFLFAVVFFSRPMAILAARLPRPELRLSLLSNVGDEHGGGDLRLSHERTFLTLLERLNVSRADIERRALWPEVRAFNTCLAGVCAMDDVYTAVAVLGIIEDLFAGLSARLGKGIVARGWLEAEAMIHYDLHAELDVDHAEDFYRLIEVPYEQDPRHAYQVEQGLELGACVFLGMYEGLYRARGRRVERSVTGPHSLADGWYLP
jgi:pyrroloquinoline quinone (PQQ) biosynthesis protein C